MTTADNAVNGITKIPDEWIRKPHVHTRTELHAMRREEGKLKGEAAIALYCSLQDQKSHPSYGRVESIFRDTYCKHGCFTHSGMPAAHCEATTSQVLSFISPIRTSLMSRRQLEKRNDSLKFEPLEIERLQGLPKAKELDLWWTKRAGYVPNPPKTLKDLHKKQKLLECTDPMKTRLCSSVESQKQFIQSKSNTSRKNVSEQHIELEIIKLNPPRQDTKLLHRPRPHANYIENVWNLPRSKIMCFKARLPIVKAGDVQEICQDSLNRRILLNQLKSLKIPAIDSHEKSMNSPSPIKNQIKNTNFNAPKGIEQINNMPIDLKSGFSTTIRCGGFTQSNIDIMELNTKR